jgi:hypothetical protein
MFADGEAGFPVVAAVVSAFAEARDDDLRNGVILDGDAGEFSSPSLIAGIAEGGADEAIQSFIHNLCGGSETALGLGKNNHRAFGGFGGKAGSLQCKHGHFG